MDWAYDAPAAVSDSGLLKEMADIWDKYLQPKDGPLEPLVFGQRRLDLLKKIHGPK